MLHFMCHVMCFVFRCAGIVILDSMPSGGQHSAPTSGRVSESLMRISTSGGQHVSLQLGETHGMGACMQVSEAWGESARNEGYPSDDDVCWATLCADIGRK